MWVGLGGALGAMLRFSIGYWVSPAGSGNPAQVNEVFPWTTLSINIAGSFAIGLFWGVAGQSEWFQNWGRLALVVGVLGGFTTFSTFSLESVTLLQNGRIGVALVYICSSALGCVAAAFAGQIIGHELAN